MSRVIRGQNEPRVVPAEVFDARTSAEKIVADAHAEAAQIVRAAQDEAASIRAHAKAQGIEEARGEVAALVVRARAAYDEAVASAQSELSRVVVAAASRVVHEELALAPERIAAIVADVVARARRAKELTVRVHPDDAPIVERMAHAIGARAGRAAPFVVYPDASVERGGCVVMTDLGELDARLSVRIDSLARALGVS